MDWYTGLGIRPDHLTLRPHDADELSHYSSATSDVEYLYPIGWSELEGIANRGDFDLTQHAEYSGEKLEYFDQQSGERYVPHVIEPAAGVGRADARLPVRRLRRGRRSAATRARCSSSTPRSRRSRSPCCRCCARTASPERAREIHATLKRAGLQSEYDEGGSIGKRYRRQDEIGTPYGVTVDHQTLEDDTVTLRDRDTLTQERIAHLRLPDELHARLAAPLDLAQAGLSRPRPGTFRSTWARTSPRRSSAARIASVTARRCARASTCSRACSRRRASTRSGARWGSRSSST